MRYLLRRVLFYLVAAWTAITINFLLPRLMPGNPVQLLVARLQGEGTLSPGAYHTLAVAFGYNTKASLISLYWEYWVRLSHLNLGISVTYYPTPVSTVIGSALPWTLALVGTATIISFVIGTSIGVLAAWRRGSWLDIALPVSTFLSAVPYFWLGLLSIEFFGVLITLFPISGGAGVGVAATFSWSFVRSAVDHAVLPALTIVVTSMAGWIVGMRNMMVTTLGEDYILVAQAKGLVERRVMLSYAARNAILPSIASFALSLSFVVSGAILVEYVFSYPGIGYVLFQAVSNEDYPLMMAIFLLITIAVLAANFVADLVYLALDPRTRQEA